MRRQAVGDLPIPSLQCLLVGQFVREPASRAEGNRERDLPALLAHRLLAWSSVRGLTSLAESNKPVVSLNRLVSVLSARSASPLTHEARLAEFQRLGVNLALQGQRGPWEKEEANGSEGARLKSADVGVGRFGLSIGLSAALGRVVPEEPLFGRVVARGRGAKEAPKPGWEDSLWQSSGRRLDTFSPAR